MTLLVLDLWQVAPALDLELYGPDERIFARAQETPAPAIVAIVGPPGPAGTSGAGFSYVATAGEALGGQRAVAIHADGKAYYVSPGDPEADSVTGLTAGAAIAGDGVTIVAGGDVQEVGWGWTPGPVYLAVDGLLTQLVPTSGAIVRIGTALNATTIYVEPRLIARL